MHVFVTGASGFVGQEVLSELRKAGHSVRILGRNPGSEHVRKLARRFSAQVHAGDVTDAKSLEGALSGMDAVIHLVGIIGEVGKTTFENVHARGTQNMLAAAKQAGVTRFVHMSALGTRPNAIARYHQTKWMAEEFVRQSGLNYTIFRPSLIYGPQDHFVNFFAKTIRVSPILPVMDYNRARFAPVAVEVVAQAFVRSLAETKAIGQTFDLCGPGAFTLSELLNEILVVMHRRRLQLHVPLFIARAQAALLEFLFPALLGKSPPLNRDQLIMLQEDNVGNPEPAVQLFALANKNFRAGIAAYL
jgi:uncharacterized protein YbjT (DUF2867 family)